MSLTPQICLPRPHLGVGTWFEPISLVISINSAPVEGDALSSNNWGQNFPVLIHLLAPCHQSGLSPPLPVPGPPIWHPDRTLWGFWPLVLCPGSYEVHALTLESLQDHSFYTYLVPSDLPLPSSEAAGKVQRPGQAQRLQQAPGIANASSLRALCSSSWPVYTISLWGR